LLILFYILLLSAFIQWLYWLTVLALPAFKKTADTPLTENQQQPVSVIICAKNEAENLKQFLPSVLQQQYNRFEVIVVNDKSNDETADVLATLQNDYPLLRVFYNRQQTLSGKRNALLLGIENAQYKWLAFTDADCMPVSPQWLQYIVAPLHRGKEISIGYSPQSTGSGFINKLVRYDTFITAVQYAGFALAGMPYMATGRNLAYTKTLFEQSKNFTGQNNPASGDDDLLINELARNNNTEVVLHHHSFVRTKSLSTWRQWLQQKTRHYSAGHHYRFSHRIALGLFYTSWLLFNVLSLVLIAMQFQLSVTVFTLVFLTIAKWLIYRLLLQRFNEPRLWIYAPLLDFIFPLFLFTLGTISLFNKDKWKN
jgi:glycosyltransferase involved in cell wall biosynthesis